MITFVVDLRTATQEFVVNLQTDTTEVVSEGESGGSGGGKEPPGPTSVGPFPPVYGDPWVNTDDCLFIYLDDVGIDLMGAISQYKTFCNTHLGIPTGVNWPAMPNLQAIANEGVVFLDAYNTDVCSPGRASWMTGRYVHRHGVTTVVNEHTATNSVNCSYPFSRGYSDFGVDPQGNGLREHILPKILSSYGVPTACIGKWHLGVPNGSLPSDTITSRWWWDGPQQGPGSPSMARGRYPWERGVSNVENAVETMMNQGDGGLGFGWVHPIVMGFDIFRGSLSNFERTPTDDLSYAFGPGTDTGPTDLAAASGMKPGYYNYLWYESDDGSDEYGHPGQIAQIVGSATEGANGNYVTTYGRRRLETLIEETASPFFINWNLHAAHSPFGYQPDNGQGYSGCLAPSSQIHADPDPYRTGSTDAAKLWDSWRSCMESIAWNIGKLRESMGEARWAATNVIIMGDNGSPNPVLEKAKADGEDFGDYETEVIDTGRGKGGMYEPGVRVPLIVSSPRVKGALGRVTRERVHVTDIFQTILDMFQVPRTVAETHIGGEAVGLPRYFDSHSFLPVLNSPTGTTSRTHVYHRKHARNGCTLLNLGGASTTASAASGFAQSIIKTVGVYCKAEVWQEGGDATSSGDTVTFTKQRSIAASRQGTYKKIITWNYGDGSLGSGSFGHELYHLYAADGSAVDPTEQTNLYVASYSNEHPDLGSDLLNDRHCINQFLDWRGSSGADIASATDSPGIYEIEYNTEPKYGWDAGAHT